jgi:hypothetical protein
MHPTAQTVQQRYMQAHHHRMDRDSQKHTVFHYIQVSGGLFIRQVETKKICCATMILALY